VIPGTSDGVELRQRPRLIPDEQREQITGVRVDRQDESSIVAERAVVDPEPTLQRMRCNTRSRLCVRRLPEPEGEEHGDKEAIPRKLTVQECTVAS
jgi:hypothetical protein